MKAVVDIGSNSVKYSLADVIRGVPNGLQSRSWVTQLGKGIDQNKMLSPQSVAATRKAFCEMAQDFASHSITQLTVVATAAVRESKNSQVIREMVEEIFSVPLQILNGLEEAKFSMLGAAAAARQNSVPTPTVFVDVGGASTEVGVLEPQFHAHSFFAGARRCFEALQLGTNAISDEKWNSAKTEMADFFPVSEWQKIKDIVARAPHSLVSVGGTLVMAAKICAPKERQSKLGVLTTLREFESLNDQLRRLDQNQRANIPGIVAERADVVCAGILILTTLMNRLNISEVFVTKWGLRHGLLLAADDR